VLPAWFCAFTEAFRFNNNSTTPNSPFCTEKKEIEKRGYEKGKEARKHSDSAVGQHIATKRKTNAQQIVASDCGEAEGATGA
jgi:ribosomal protein S4